MKHKGEKVSKTVVGRRKFLVSWKFAGGRENGYIFD